MTVATIESMGRRGEDQRERLLWVLSAATFLIFFQGYMVYALGIFGAVQFVATVVAVLLFRSETPLQKGAGL